MLGVDQHQQLQVKDLKTSDCSCAQKIGVSMLWWPIYTQKKWRSTVVLTKDDQTLFYSSKSLLLLAVTANKRCVDGQKKDVNAN